MIELERHQQKIYETMAQKLSALNSQMKDITNQFKDCQNALEGYTKEIVQSHDADNEKIWQCTNDFKHLKMVEDDA